MSFTKSQFDWLKEKRGMFGQFSSYFDYLAKTGQTSHSAGFLEWVSRMDDKERADFEYCFEVDNSPLDANS
jgi:hypothetical protein